MSLQNSSIVFITHDSPALVDIAFYVLPNHSTDVSACVQVGPCDCDQGSPRCNTQTGTEGSDPGVLERKQGAKESNGLTATFPILCFGLYFFLFDPGRIRWSNLLDSSFFQRSATSFVQLTQFGQRNHRSAEKQCDV